MAKAGRPRPFEEVQGEGLLAESEHDDLRHGYGGVGLRFAGGGVESGAESSRALRGTFEMAIRRRKEK